MTDAYLDFLKAKVQVQQQSGPAIEASALNPVLRPVAQVAAQWLARGGRRALFSKFGLHKTTTQLEVMRLIGLHDPGLRLITLPLGVRQEFFNDAKRYFQGEHALDLRFIRSASEIGDERTIYLTNYETVREGKLDPRIFKAASLDEAAILRGFGGTKTFREFMKLFAGDDREAGVRTEGVKYRFVATATPDPNEFIELLAYAAYLGVMDVGDAKQRWFKRDSEKADHLTLQPSKEREFWLWVSSWALFIRTPSDVGLSDEGYTLPPLEVRWHEIPTDHRDAGTERDGQGRMFKSAALGVTEASREKRESIEARVAKVAEIARAERAAGAEQVVVWCDLNDEQDALEKALAAEGITSSSLYGNQSIEEREALLEAWRAKKTAAFVSKPVMYGAGINMQQCHTMIFAGITHKFVLIAQAIHRIQRFGQLHPCRVHFVFTEAEQEIRRDVERKWRQHDEQAERMSAIIREFGLSQAALAAALRKDIGIERREASGRGWRLVNNDCIREVASMESDSVDLIVTSIPFGTQYTYTSNHADFGATKDNDHFFEQMDFLTRELLRVLKPGRVAAIHVKDRVTPGGINGLGFQTVTRFSDQCADHFERHGFAFMARKTVVTDVVRENNQTYRLGWTEQCKDATKMGAGLPEYVLLFRKPPTERSRSYADTPVVKAKKEAEFKDGAFVGWKNPRGYSRARWQLDAHGSNTRSSGDRLLDPDELRALPHEANYKLFREHSLSGVYDFEEHVAIAEKLEELKKLPSTFMLLPPASWHPDVWADIARMRTSNMLQVQHGRENHVCPLQWDIVDRLIVQESMEGETVLDPFVGVGTVVMRAIALGRCGIGIELSARYFEDATFYCKAQERKLAVPTLFDLDGEAAALKRL